MRGAEFSQRKRDDCPISPNAVSCLDGLRLEPDMEAAAGPDPSRPTSTWGGGSGFTVIYGVAAPVKPPRIGKVQKYERVD
jgi:hypothetical protein